MSISHLLEDFGALAQGDVVEITDVLLEEERLEAFEKGYQAGWEDSAKAKVSEAGHVSIELAQAIADMSLTYEEAFSALLKGVHPLITQIITTVLPATAAQTLAPRVTELIGQLVADHGRCPVVICAAPTQAPALRSIEIPAADMHVSIEEDPALAPDAVRLRFGERIEQEIDLASTIAEISEVIDAYFNTGMTEEQRIFA